MSNLKHAPGVICELAKDFTVKKGLKPRRIVTLAKIDVDWLFRGSVKWQVEEDSLCYDQRVLIPISGPSIDTTEIDDIDVTTTDELSVLTNC
jgi:hypothetical protein